MPRPRQQSSAPRPPRLGIPSANSDSSPIGSPLADFTRFSRRASAAGARAVPPTKAGGPGCFHVFVDALSSAPPLLAASARDESPHRVPASPARRALGNRTVGGGCGWGGQFASDPSSPRSLRDLTRVDSSRSLVSRRRYRPARPAPPHCLRQGDRRLRPRAGAVSLPVTMTRLDPDHIRLPTSAFNHRRPAYRQHGEDFASRAFPGSSQLFHTVSRTEGLS